MSQILLTPKHSNSQNIWRSLPWGTFLFLLAVFVFSTPLYSFDLYWRPEISVDDAFGVADVMHRDNWARIGALVALGAYALFRFLKFRQDRFKINGLLGWLIVFYVLWALFSVTWSIDPRFSLKRAGILLFLSLGALFAAERISLHEIKNLVLVICGASVLIGFYIALHTHTFHPSMSWWRFGANQHPISQAWHCGLLVMSALALANTDEQNRRVYIGIAIIGLFFLILTRSRMAFVACFMGSAVYLGLVETKPYRGVLIFFGIIIVGCLTYFILGNELLGISDKVITLGRVGEVQSMSTLTGRIPLWKACMKLVHQRPFVGYGYDSFLSSENLIWISKELGWATSSPHSAYIATIGGLGYIGFGTLLLILILSFTRSIRLAKQNSEYAFMTAVVVWLIFNMYTEDQVLTRPYFPVFLWMIMFARLGFVREES